MACKCSYKEIKKVVWFIFLLSFTYAGTSFCAETPYPPGEGENPLSSSGLAGLLRGSRSDSRGLEDARDVVLVDEEDEESILLRKCLKAIESNDPDGLKRIITSQIDSAALLGAQEALQQSLKGKVPNGDTSITKAARILSIILSQPEKS